MDKIQIASLHVYPVKSCRGIEMTSTRVTPLGLEYDREWMMVMPNGRFISQRQIPQLALVETVLSSDSLKLEISGQSIEVPLDSSAGEAIDVTIWSDDCAAIDEGEAVSTWLTRNLDSQFPIRLVRKAPDARRSQSHSDILGKGTTTMFADAGPYAFASEASLAALCESLSLRGESVVPMDRFRPNVVLNGLEAFDEHRIRDLSTEGIGFRLRAPIERCIMTTIDQQTAEKHPRTEPFETLRHLNPSPRDDRKPAFAQYATLTRGEGLLLAKADRFVAAP